MLKKVQKCRLAATLTLLSVGAFHVVGAGCGSDSSSGEEDSTENSQSTSSTSVSSTSSETNTVSATATSTLTGSSSVSQSESHSGQTSTPTSSEDESSTSTELDLSSDSTQTQSSSGTGTSSADTTTTTDGCEAPELVCNGECVDPTIDGRYCGASGDCQGNQAGEVCWDDQTCVGGTCHDDFTWCTELAFTAAGEESGQWQSAVSWGEENLLAVYRTDATLWSVVRIAGEWSAAEEIGTAGEFHAISRIPHDLQVNPLSGDALLIWYDATDLRFNLWQAASQTWRADQGERLSPAESGTEATLGWQAYGDGVFVSVSAVTIDATDTKQLLLRRIDHGSWIEPVKLPAEIPSTASFVSNGRGEGALVWSDPVGKRIIGRRLHADFTLADAVEVATTSALVDLQAVMLLNGTLVAVARVGQDSHDWQSWELPGAGTAWQSTGPFVGANLALVHYTDNEPAVVYSKQGDRKNIDKIWLTSRVSGSLTWNEPLLVAYDYFGWPSVRSDQKRNLLLKTNSVHGIGQFTKSHDHFWSRTVGQSQWRKGPTSGAGTSPVAMLSTSGLPMALRRYKDDLPTILSVSRAWDGTPGLCP